MGGVGTNEKTLGFLGLGFSAIGSESWALDRLLRGH
jgi:hypothetical protein